MAFSGDLTGSDYLAGKQYLRPEFAQRIEGGDTIMQSLANAHENYRGFYERMTAAVKQRDPELTEDGHFLQMRDLAFKTATRAGAANDRANESALVEIEVARSALQTQLGLTEDHRASEIRTYFRSLSDQARTKLLQGAVESGDAKTVAAITEAPNYLTGLSGETVAGFKAQYERKHGGDLPARIRDLEQAIAINKQTAKDALAFLDRLLPNAKFQDIQKRQAAAKALKDKLLEA